MDGDRGGGDVETVGVRKQTLGQDTERSALGGAILEVGEG